MADHPAGKQGTTVDRTSALDVDNTSKLVSGGLVALAVLGVVTVFFDTIAAAWSPSAPASAATASAPAPAAPSPPTGGGGSP
jgi:hypothetical protein